MDKYFLFNLTDKKISSAIINNIILSGIDLANIENIGFQNFFEITGIKKEEVYEEIINLKKNLPTLYNIFALTSCGVSDKVCQNLSKMGVNYLFILNLYPDILLKQRFNLTDNQINKIRQA
ncbi:MAG: hypothetical protein K6B64_03050, partial [Acholeplasmatales bacterium]|nr:hypothetical protein [Acholeplasmatales bacterium]